MLQTLFKTVTYVPIRSSRPDYSVLIYYPNLSDHLLPRISSAWVKAQEQRNKLRKENLSEHDPTLIATEWEATTFNTAILSYNANEGRNNAHPGALGRGRSRPAQAGARWAAG